mmetsp:Transcript_30042/g.39528  ORF Transcript_30042/g.39528 Transcript_30042/m.39528 type:complete len:205 (-) Transcript_30042:472-1086(-)|eukprot:CAMPEP_0117754016 /NCGR_PEP_ID=MMETSP0947-20121206/12581_1 /TAXON_ID=44440 /ORGANISM="Chattonella subsalsa, Strain CCMP2191" /LENGTH=204 /DNA_ID=CAMNT_0005573031 /DNA_START=59 /DNA_END=673 /DNA_ORIENTATION=-
MDEEKLPDEQTVEDDVKPETNPVVYEYPVEILYCGVCGLPPEYCEFGENYEQCLPWIQENCPEILDVTEAEEKMGEMKIEDGAPEEEGGKKKKKTKRGGQGPKKKAGPSGPQKVVMSLATRNRRKFITTITGLENFPGVKLKTAAKLFGRTFSCGSSVSDSPTGKEIVIQGDCIYDLPGLLEREYQIPLSQIFMLENGKEVPIG